MPVEVLIVALTIAAALALVVGAAGTLAEFTRTDKPRVPLLARYRRGRHRAAQPPLLARLAAAYLNGAREMAAAFALLKGVPL